MTYNRIISNDMSLYHVACDMSLLSHDILVYASISEVSGFQMNLKSVHCQCKLFTARSCSLLRSSETRSRTSTVFQNVNVMSVSDNWALGHQQIVQCAIGWHIVHDCCIGLRHLVRVWVRVHSTYLADLLDATWYNISARPAWHRDNMIQHTSDLADLLVQHDTAYLADLRLLDTTWYTISCWRRPPQQAQLPPELRYRPASVKVLRRGLKRRRLGGEAMDVWRTSAWGVPSVLYPFFLPFWNPWH